ncbi:hypothetical protein AgCh_025217 [Apium graveolens]
MVYDLQLGLKISFGSCLLGLEMDLKAEGIFVGGNKVVHFTPKKEERSSNQASLNGFGNYDVFQNNCEDFALYCRTGLLTIDRLGVGRSGQASTVIGAPLAALLSSPLKLLMPSPIAVAIVTAGMYCMSRYATDIGVRSDVIKVAVEDLAVNLGWMDINEVHVKNKLSDEQIVKL